MLWPYVIGLEKNSTWDRIEELCNLGKLSPVAAKKLKQVLCLAELWRLRAYSSYGCQREFVDVMLRLNTSEKLKTQNTHMGLTEGDIAEFTEAYKTLIPLQKCAELFCQSQGVKNSFVSTSLYDQTSFTLGCVANRLCQYRKAAKHFKFAVNDIRKDNAKDPMLATTLSYLGLAWKGLGAPRKAKGYLQEALDMTNKGDSQALLTTRMSNLAAVLEDLGEASEAENRLMQALTIATEAFGRQHIKVAEILNNLGALCQTLGKSKEALKHLKESLEINTAINGPDHPNLATNCINIGWIWQTLGEGEKARECYEQALAIDIKLYGQHHPNLTSAFNNLGLYWIRFGDAKQAIYYLEMAAKIYIKVYGKNHPIMATIINNLGLAWKSLDLKRALKYCKIALNMTVAFCGDQHPAVAKKLYTLGSIFLNMDKVEQAIGCFGSALVIHLKAYKGRHINVAVDLNQLGLAADSNTKCNTPLFT